MHGGICVPFCISTLINLQNGENCWAVTSVNGLFEMFSTSNFGRMPKSGAVSRRQLPMFRSCSGALTGFSNFCKKKSQIICVWTNGKLISLPHTPSNRPAVAINGCHWCASFSATASAAIPMVLWWVHLSKGQWPRQKRKIEWIFGHDVR